MYICALRIVCVCVRARASHILLSKPKSYPLAPGEHWLKSGLYIFVLSKKWSGSCLCLTVVIFGIVGV